jgi:rhodanese-related sulfurtransferase
MLPELTARQLADRLNGPNPPLLLDVREPHEHAYCHIPGAQLKPLGEIEEWAKALDSEAEIVCQCHTGVRSYHAARYLQHLGFKKVYNLRGGIEAWSADVDPSVPRY